MRKMNLNQKSASNLNKFIQLEKDIVELTSLESKLSSLTT